MKITEDIYQVGGAGFTSPEDAAIYLISMDGHHALVDAGCGRMLERLFQNMAACGVYPRDLEYLLITHCHYDHTGGARAVKERTACRVVAHEKDAVFLEKGDSRVTAASWYGERLEPFRVDWKLSSPRVNIPLGGQTIEAIHMPGHSPGSLVYLTRSQGQKVVFAQDVHGPLNESLLSNRQDYLHSLGMLLDLDTDILCEGHYGVIEGKKKIRAFIRSFMRT